MNKLTNNELDLITSRLNHGVECELKYVNEKLIANKTKRKLLFKGVALDYDQIKAILEQNPQSKIEMKIEKGQLVIVLVERQQLF